MSDRLLQSRPLESRLFGVAIAAAFVETVESVATLTSALHEGVAEMVVARVDATNFPAIHALEAADALLCDVLLTMTAGAASHQEHAEQQRIELRAADVADAPAIARIAGLAFHDFKGHWHTDPRLSREHADTLYARWGADLGATLSHERPIAVAVDADNSVMGFVALNALGAGLWNVPLAAVDPGQQSRGVLRHLLWAIRAGFLTDGMRRLDYETQLTNVAALRSVARTGFVPSTSRLTFHLWTPKR